MYGIVMVLLHCMMVDARGRILCSMVPSLLRQVKGGGGGGTNTATVEQTGTGPQLPDNTHERMPVPHGNFRETIENRKV